VTAFVLGAVAVAIPAAVAGVGPTLLLALAGGALNCLGAGVLSRRRG